MSSALEINRGLRPLCERPGGKKAKVTYPSELAARAAAVYYAQGHYECPRCGGWHLTTRGKKTHTKRQAHIKSRRLTPQGSYR